LIKVFAPGHPYPAVLAHQCHLVVHPVNHCISRLY
jgi:hypothetical protein